MGLPPSQPTPRAADGRRTGTPRLLAPPGGSPPSSTGYGNTSSCASGRGTTHAWLVHALFDSRRADAYRGVADRKDIPVEHSMSSPCDFARPQTGAETHDHDLDAAPAPVASLMELQEISNCSRVRQPCALRARWPPVDAASRLSIVRERHSARRIRSCSLAPTFSQRWGERGGAGVDGPDRCPPQVRFVLASAVWRIG
jgi:hypothetical protein